MRPYTLGIDTSCYTTSLAVVDAQGNLLFEKRKMLEVKKGARGLRQSEGFFQHVMNLPDILKSASEAVDMEQIGCVAVSTRPRNQEGSYMPVFTAGERFAKSLSIALQVPMFTTTHQDGHIMAAAKSCGLNHEVPHIALHLSGGTSEILNVGWNAKEASFSIEIVGGSLDVSAGQLIDRIGVAMGYGFPCGKYLDGLALNAEACLKFPVSVKETYFNLSGAEAYGLKYIEEGKDKAAISKGLFSALEKTLFKSLSNVCEMTGKKHVLMAGGVSSSVYLKSVLPSRFKKMNVNILFAEPAYAADNAIGVAHLGNEQRRGGADEA